MRSTVLKATALGAAAVYVWYFAVTHVGEVKARKAQRRGAS